MSARPQRAADHRGVLMIANDFPPIGGAGVQRSVYFAKYLPDAGWEPTVLTVREVAYPVKDPSLLDELPASVRIVRTHTLELRRLLWLVRRVTRRGRGEAGRPRSTAAAADTEATGRAPRELGRSLRRWLFVPDDRLLWAPFALAAAQRLARAGRIRVVFATLPAYSSGVIGYLVSLWTGLPLVLDLRDPWTQDPYFPAPTPIHARLNDRLEAAALRRAARIVVTSREMRRRILGRYPELPEDRVRVITNGFDAEAFAGIEPVERSGRFVVSYVGSLYAHHLAVVRSVCEGWRRAARRDAGFAAEAELDLIGRCDPEIATELAALEGVPARIVGYLPHREAAAHLKGSSLLLLLIRDLDPEHHLVTIPGKLFEYLGAGPPVLMVGPEGDAADLVRESGGEVLREADADGIAAALLAGYRGESHRAVTDDPRHRYDRRVLTRDLADVLDAVATSEPG